jgi:radical SAM protein with 4Fe4S-binding SPASM domain
MIPAEPPPARLRGDAEAWSEPRPAYAVWEITLRCDQPCGHCGSRAGAARERELSTEEALEVASALVRLGCREVALIGGEAYLRDDLHTIVAFFAERGVHVGIQTGGRRFTRELARSLKDAGLAQLGVSVDGPAEVHDLLRGIRGSHAAALGAMDAAAEVGLELSANSQVNRLNRHLLRETCAELRAHGAAVWQVQLTVPMGRAADHPEWILEPWRIVEVVDTLAEIQLEAARTHTGGLPFNVFCGNNIGYYGPHEHVLRSRPGGPEVHWQGCRAGVWGIGIESDGTVKGCPSLPTAPYAGGNVRELSLEQIWQSSEALRFVRDRTVDELWGYCRSCYYAEECMAGCAWTVHCTLGRRGNNPFCYHRASDLRKQGLRERLVHKQRPPRAPYDFGRFEIALEPWSDEAPETPAATPQRRLPLVG